VAPREDASGYGSAPAMTTIEESHDELSDRGIAGVEAVDGIDQPPVNDEQHAKDGNGFQVGFTVSLDAAVVH
jgi:hypothetical protein